MSNIDESAYRDTCGLCGMRLMDGGTTANRRSFCLSIVITLPRSLLRADDCPSRDVRTSDTARLSLRWRLLKLNLPAPGNELCKLLKLRT